MVLSRFGETRFERPYQNAATEVSASGRVDDFEPSFAQSLNEIVFEGSRIAPRNKSRPNDLMPLSKEGFHNGTPTKLVLIYSHLFVERQSDVSLSRLSRNDDVNVPLARTAKVAHADPYQALPEKIIAE